MGILKQNLTSKLPANNYGSAAPIVLFSFISAIITLLVIPVHFPDTHTLLNLLFYVASTVGFTIGYFVIASLILSFQPAGEDRLVSRREFWRDLLLYSLCCMVVWSLYFLSFYPGIMSPDSFDQWKQIVTFSFSDWHPPFHTLIMWCLTRIWLSPAIVCLFQMAALSMVFSYGLVTLKQLSVPRVVIYVLLAVFCLNPLNGLYSNTLWKDILYGVVMLWITILLIKVVRNEAGFFSSKVNLVKLSVLLASVILIRHNGILAVLAVILGLLIYCREYWRRVVLIGCVTFALTILVQGPMYNAMKVRKGAYPNLYYLMAHQISAVASAHGYFKQSELDFLNKVTPISAWVSNYNRYGISPLVFNSDTPFDVPFIFENKSQFVITWRNIVMRNPWIVIKHQIIVDSLVWRISEPPDGYLYLIEGLNRHVVGIGDNELGLKSSSILPGWKKNLTNLIEILCTSTYSWIFFRPALYLFSSLFFIALLCIKFRNSKYLLVAAPLIFNSFGLILTNPSQDVRYMYLAFLIAPILCGYLFSGTCNNSELQENTLSRKF